MAKVTDGFITKIANVKVQERRLDLAEQALDVDWQLTLTSEERAQFCLLLDVCLAGGYPDQ